MCLCVCGISKPNQTKLNQTNQTKLNQSKPKTVYFLFVQTVYPNQTKPNLLNNKLKITASNKIKPKVPEKRARAAQLLYRPVLVKLVMEMYGHRELLSGSVAAKNI